MEGVEFRKKPLLKNATLICAWPGMGDVAFKAASYLAEQLKAEPFAEIPADDFFYLTGNVIQDGLVRLPELPYSRFLFWKNPAAKRKGRLRNVFCDTCAGDLVIFTSNAQPDLTKAQDYCARIIAVARAMKVKMVVTLAAMPQPIEHTQQPAVWFAGTSSGVNEHFKKYNPSVLQDGQISGMNGLFLGMAKRAGLEGFCLLGEIPLYTIQIENPKASLAVLKLLTAMLHIDVSFESLLSQVRTIDAEINKLLDYLKVGSSGQAGPIGEDEIEKIKKTLSQLTKLPLSMKEKIERLFEQAKTDISKAAELKFELDKWNVYKEYEDRFLDLFKRTEDTSN
ncbi:MAG: PAC2 family protein [Candidatus Omnitrophica bacterium]|nr:PAC2 family protein [Candidatus Omnitrophota bacterium]